MSHILYGTHLRQSLVLQPIMFWMLKFQLFDHFKLHIVEFEMNDFTLAVNGEITYNPVNG